MCEHGSLDLTRLRATQFNRRGFLRATAASTLTLALGAGAAHAAETHIKSTHGSGFCNLNYFLANALQTAKDDGVMLDFIITPTFAEQVTFLGSGQVDAGLIPYTSFVALYRCGRAGEDHCRRRHPGLCPGRPARPRQSRKTEGQDPRHVPDGYARSAAVRLDEKERRCLQGHQRALYGQHAGGGRGVQGRRARPDLHDRTVWHRAAQRREGQRHAVRRHRYLRSWLYRLRAGGAHRIDQAEPDRAQVPHQGDDERAVHGGDEA